VQARGVDSVGKGFKDPATIVKSLAGRESKLRHLLSSKADKADESDRQSLSLPCLARRTTSRMDKRHLRLRMGVIGKEMSRAQAVWLRRKFHDVRLDSWNDRLTISDEVADRWPYLLD